MMSCKGKQRSLEAAAWKCQSGAQQPLNCTPFGTVMHICALCMPQTICNIVHVGCEEDMRSAGMSEPCMPHHTTELQPDCD